MPEAPTPDWRDSGNTPAQTPSAKPWQAGATSAEAGPSAMPSKRSFKRLFAVVALLGLAVGIGAVVYWFRPIKPACLVLVGSGYETNLLLPHNVHGWNSLHVLEKAVSQGGELPDLWRFFTQPTKMRRVGAEPVELKEANWRAVWDKLGIANYEEKTVMVFLSVHGAADAKEAYLLPNVPGKQMLESFDQSRIPFQEVLDSLKAVKGKKIVLLLDVCHAPFDQNTGMLHNDFAERLKTKYEKEIEATPHLAVICSADTDQRSWASDELQATAFAYYVMQALKGANHGKDGNVTAGSLFDYVKDKVATWARTNRARSQTPFLLGGKDRADGMDLVHIAEPYVEPAPPSAPLNLDALAPEWEKWKKLKREKAPHVHNPHLWRLYQDTLLRYEQLLRAGDPTGKAAASLKPSLEKLNSDIAASRSLDGAFPCMVNSFPLYRVLGFQPAPDLNDKALNIFLTDFRNLADQKGKEEEKKKLLTFFRDKSIQVKQYVRVRVNQMLLKDWQANASPDQAKRNREQGQDRLAEIEDYLVAKQRPVEMQLVKMLRDVDPEMPEEVIQAALAVRVLAEEVALSAMADADSAEQPSELYAEVIFPWVRAGVEAADKSRREGEDYLFGDPKLHGPKAKAKFAEAKNLYEKARAMAQKLQVALAVRDEVSADLPYFATWLARNPPLPDADRADLGEALEKLSVGLAKLNRALDAADRAELPAPDLARQAASDLKFLRERFQDVGDNLRTVAAQQKNWHALDAALSAPPSGARDDVALRKGLLRKLRDISSALLLNPNPDGRIEEEGSVEQRVKQRRELARISLKAFDDLGNPDKENTDAQLRDFFLKAPGSIVAKTVLAGGEGADLVRAANLCRVIPGGYADFVKDDTGRRINPLDRLRRLRTHALLLGLAERTLGDHWFEPGIKKLDPYYQVAGKDYLKAARGLFDDEPIPDALVKKSNSLNEKLILTELKLGKLGTRHWTTESDFDLPYHVTADDGLPRGTPMIWLKVGSEPAKKSGGPRKEMKTWPKFSDAFPLGQIDIPATGAAQVELNAYYRGQHLRQDSPYERLEPNVIVRHAPALEANTRLAVRMDSKFDYGAISIVLDNSGSMKYRHPREGGKDDYANRKANQRRRFDFALDALEHVLRKVPENTYLSLFTLGDKKNRVPALYRPARRWRQEEFDGLRKELAEIPADIGSPIAEAVIKSMAEGFPEGKFRGPKVILVLTDGDDNGSFFKEEGNRTKRIVAELKAANAKHPDIAVVVVCFIKKDADEKAKSEFESAKAQFGCVEQFKRPGRFTDQPDAEKLGTTIEEMIRPRVQLLRLAEQDPIKGFEVGYPINYHFDKTLNWIPARSGIFNAHVLRTSANPLVNVQILPGQKMFMVLNRTDEDLSLKRGLLAFQPETIKRGEWRREKEGWVVSLLENEHPGLGKGMLKQLLAFEKLKDDKDRIRQPVPGLTWIELDAVKSALPNQTLRMWRDWDVPAPAMRLEIRDWVVGVQPKVAAWFWPGDRDSLLANTKLVTRKQVPVPLARESGGDAVELPVIEEVNWKERNIEVASGGTKKEFCLMVRVRHARGKPVWVDLETREPGNGSEHHYFHKADSCTTYFYGMEKPTTARLVLIDLAEFKGVAEGVAMSPDVVIQAPPIFLNQARKD